jgi:hypothetical protein
VAVGSTAVLSHKVRRRRLRTPMARQSPGPALRHMGDEPCPLAPRAAAGPALEDHGDLLQAADSILRAQPARLPARANSAPEYAETVQ